MTALRLCDSAHAPAASVGVVDAVNTQIGPINIEMKLLVGVGYTCIEFGDGHALDIQALLVLAT